MAFEMLQTGSWEMSMKAGEVQTAWIRKAYRLICSNPRMQIAQMNLLFCSSKEFLFWQIQITNFKDISGFTSLPLI